MGDIVAAYGTSHILFSPQAAPELAQEIVEGMTGLGHRLKDAKPDLVVLITSDHLYNFDLAHQVPFCIGTAASYHAMGDMGIPQRAFRGHVNFAENLVRFADDQGFTIRPVEEVLELEPLVPDHAVTLPMMFIKPWGHVPVVPLYTGIHLEPFPSTADCLALGQIIHDYVDQQRPAGERIAVIASGGCRIGCRSPAWEPSPKTMTKPASKRSWPDAAMILRPRRRRRSLRVRAMAASSC